MSLHDAFCVSIISNKAAARRLQNNDTSSAGCIFSIQVRQAGLHLSKENKTFGIPILDDAPSIKTIDTIQHPVYEVLQCMNLWLLDKEVINAAVEANVKQRLATIFAPPERKCFLHPCAYWAAATLLQMMMVILLFCWTRTSSRANLVCRKYEKQI